MQKKRLLKEPIFPKMSFVQRTNYAAIGGLHVNATFLPLGMHLKSTKSTRDQMFH